MPGKIFVNYRRDDSAANALSIAQYLERTFGARNVFLDIDRMRAGQNFPTVLEEKLAGCKVMLAIIGPSWLTLADEKGARRIDDPTDWVRLEIARALARGVTVIPVLVAGASLPRKTDLPPELQPLVECHAAVITTNGFRNEMAGLERDIRSLVAPRPWGRIVAGVAGLSAIAATAGWFALHPLSMPDIAKPVEPMKQEARSANPPAPQDTATAVLQHSSKQPPAPAMIDPERLAAIKAEVDRKIAEAEAKLDPALKVTPGSGQSFRDCADVCPEMVVVPAGSFTMGSNANDNEKPPHKVIISKPFAVGKFVVSFAEWDACSADGGCKSNQKPFDVGWGRANRPVVNVSWHDAQEYAAWLSRRTGKTYRLPAESEWEYAARAGTTTKYFWGDAVGKDNANCDGCGSRWDGKQIAPVGSFKPNAFGLYDMHGNVWQWVEDYYYPKYKGAPADGSAWTTGPSTSRVVRGGVFTTSSSLLSSASRDGYSAASQGMFGLRLARAIE